MLAYSGLFIAEDACLRGVFETKANAGVNVGMTLGDQDSPQVAERGAEEGIGEAMTAAVVLT